MLVPLDRDQPLSLYFDLGVQKQVVFIFVR